MSGEPTGGGPRDTRVVLADDHLVVREGLVRILQAEDGFDVVGQAGDGREAVRLGILLRPDVVLMDLRMPLLDGVAAIAELARRAPDVHTVVLTAYDSDTDILRAIEAGASGYLLKDAGCAALVDAVRGASRGETILTPLAESRPVERPNSSSSDRPTPREAEVLTLVGRGASNRQAARSLGIRESTVKSHLEHLFVKLGVNDRTAAVVRAIELGVIAVPLSDRS